MSNQIKIEKGNFTTVQNELFRAEIDGKKLSLEAWGLYVFMLSLPEDWDYTINGLTTILNAGKNKISRVLNELEKAGLLVRKQENIKGKFGKINYILKSNIEPFPQKPSTVKPSADFEPQQNTKEQSIIDKLKDKGENSPQFTNDLNNFKTYKTKNANNHFLTNELISAKLISNLDYHVNNFNDLFEELDNNYDHNLVLIATRYLRDYILKKGVKSFDNVYAYFSASIRDNLILLHKKNYSYNLDLPDWVIESQKELEQIELD